MTLDRRHFTLSVAASASFPALARDEAAFLSRPLRIVCPFAPGGGSDFMARVAAGILAERLGQTALVDDRPGAGGILGTENAVKSPADGHTLLLVAGSYTVNPALYKLGFDPVADIAPVIQLSRGAYVLCTNPKLPARGLWELLALARRSPGRLTFASAGTGSHLHIVTEYLLMMAKVRCTHVPYKGTAPALNDVLAGNVDMMFAGTEAAMQHVRAGRLRAIAVGTAGRLAAYPQIPSVAESGLPGYDVVAWHGLVAPRGVAPSIVSRLNGELNSGLKAKNMEARLEPTGVGAAGGTPGQFAALIEAEIVRYAQVVREGGIKAE